VLSSSFLSTPSHEACPLGGIASSVGGSGGSGLSRPDCLWCRSATGTANGSGVILGNIVSDAVSINSTTIVGNTFRGLLNGVVLSPGAEFNRVGANGFYNVTTQVGDYGSGNTVTP
jgi:hypothetical protein